MLIFTKLCFDVIFATKAANSRGGESQIIVTGVSILYKLSLNSIPTISLLTIKVDLPSAFKIDFFNLAAIFFNNLCKQDGSNLYFLYFCHM